MDRLQLRLFAYALMALIVGILKQFTDLDNNVIISIALIGVILILIGYVYKTKGRDEAIFFIVMILFLLIPTSILFFSGIPNSLPGPWGGILIGITASISILIGLITCIKFFDLKNF